MLDAWLRQETLYALMLIALHCFLTATLILMLHKRDPFPVITL